MSTGIYICNVCERDGKPPGERFKVPADEIGVALMEQHLSADHRSPWHSRRDHAAGTVTAAMERQAAKRAAHQAKIASGETT